MPVASELRTARSPTQIVFNRLPSCQAVAVHVVGRDLVGDALVAQGRDKPIEQDRRVPRADGRGNFVRSTGIVENCGRANEATHSEDQPSCMIQSRTVLCPRATVRTRELDVAGIHRGQIIATSLRWASVSPSMYRWVVWIDR